LTNCLEERFYLFCFFLENWIRWWSISLSHLYPSTKSKEFPTSSFIACFRTRKEIRANSRSSRTSKNLFISIQIKTFSSFSVEFYQNQHENRRHNRNKNDQESSFTWCYSSWSCLSSWNHRQTYPNKIRWITSIQSSFG
jgi:hypothetical protein